MPKAEKSRAEKIFSGGGEMGALMRSFDWSKTLLGSVETWPQSLRTMVSVILNSRYPMFIWWGTELVALYNDAYRPILGSSKHPHFLGKSAKEMWADIWDTIGPLADIVMKTGLPTWSEDLLLPMNRYGYLEETYFTFSYSPVRDESGGVGGVFCACTETTERVIGERRLQTLRDLAANTVEAKTVDEACRLATATLSHNAYDVPFALLYRVKEDDSQPHLISATSNITPETIAHLQQNDPWHLNQVIRTHTPTRVSHLTLQFGEMLSGAWPEPTDSALVMPIAQAGQQQLAAILVLGISPRRAFDDEYQGFFDLVASHIGTAIANADAYEAERKRAEALAEIDRAKTVFFSNVSHELRTPLTLMLGPLSDVLAHSDLSSDAKKQLELAYRNSQRLLKLVNTLLDFSRIEAGRIDAVYQPTDLAILTADLAGVFRSVIEAAGLRLVVDCPPMSEPAYVDREMWEKIVLNLLSNAFKFTFEGEISVIMRSDNRHITLEVRDTGTGIRAEELPRIFERFQRVKGAKGRSYEGSGIGLALVQELVHLHGGTIKVSSKINQGTCFTVTIPTGYAHLPSERISATRTQSATTLKAAPYVEEMLRWLPESTVTATVDAELALPSARSSQTGRILLADDNADLRDYLKRLLSQYYEVETVADGAAALASIGHLKPDLVLTDVMMPKIDGFELLRKLRCDPQTKDLPIILLSARAGEESRIEGLDAGADDYLIKPFSARELLARVEATLKLSRLRKQSAQALSKSEKRAQLALKVGRLGTWRYNLNTNLVELDRRMREIWGKTSDTVALPLMRMMERVHPDDRSLLTRVVTEAFRANSSGLYEVEYRVIWPDASEHWVVVNGQVQYEDERLSSRPVGIFGIALDITERKQAELRLQQQTREVQQLNAHLSKSTAELDRRNQELDRFAYVVSHDLKAPLRAITNLSNWIEEDLSGNIPESTEHQLQLLRQRVQRMESLIDGLLVYSRAGRVEVTEQKTDVAQLVADIIDSLMPPPSFTISTLR